MARLEANVPALIEALTRRECYPHPVGSVERLETHISWVLLTGAYAYKIKKPVRLGFLDFSSLEARRQYCEEELRLNRRLAPGIYLDVVEIRGLPGAPRVGGTGPVLEYAVKMHQFPQEALAIRLLARGALDPALVSRLASRVAAFHAQLPPAPAESGYGTPDSVIRNARDNFAQIFSLLAATDDHEAAQSVHDWTGREFMIRQGDLRARHASGRVRECHGDLHLGNIVLLDGELVPFDCIEFNADLRWNDVMSEVAFLMMDLLDRGAPRLAWLFLNEYLKASGDYSGLSVLPFYLTYRGRSRENPSFAREPGAGGSRAHSTRRRISRLHASRAAVLQRQTPGYAADARLFRQRQKHHRPGAGAQLGRDPRALRCGAQAIPRAGSLAA